MQSLNNSLNQYIDVSVPISPHLPRWPGSPEIIFQQSLNLEHGDVANDTTLNFSVHTGTHIDAPLHFIRGGKSVDQISLNQLIGEAYVAVLPDEVQSISSATLNKLSIPQKTKRLLLKTRNSELWRDNVSEFQQNFVALTSDAAQWVVDREIQVIGIDYLSVQRYFDGPETHQILLDEEIIIIEGLNLTGVLEGRYELICLPLKLKGIEGAPARVVLRQLPV